jgi:hypothetical protein
LGIVQLIAVNCLPYYRIERLDRASIVSVIN